ncbi:insulin-degrading enzyme isoform X2 [Chelonus insularis]|uniref:insulin-degrading enzyme isoform X2 n=1 Tax=Chelonus insularis TaxID=460826 RepID=UPI00158DDD4C|nr:insulin-degrading enzyme isoform X2 [Chelonus insularis]
MTSLGENLEISSNSTSPTLYSSMECGVPKVMDNEGLIKKRYEDIKKSPNDNRLYRGLILKNDMKVLLISDSTTDKSAAALNVNVGYFCDPEDLPGLAHFCEHMLFLGTEKYPSTSEYTSFLSQHGGGCNASTLLDYTNYYFDVTPESLEGALDRFSQFFLKPLFTESSTELEVNAVDSEHEKNLANDTWRIEQIDRSSANPNHPYAKFGTGNKETLDTIPKEKGTNVRDALLKFHEDWYSANIMALSVLGKENLDDLEKLVVKMFSEVKNKEIEAPEWPEHPFNEDQFQHKWFIVPIKDVRKLKMMFPLPDLRENFRSSPANYISHLIGHEGDGSLLSALKRAGWSNSLVAGMYTLARGGCNFFNIAVDLTEEGIQHVDDIITLTFQYINMLRQAGPIEWIFEEYKQIAQMEFNFREKSSPQAYVNKTVRALQHYPMEEILSGSCLPTEWRPDLINLVMDYLKPQNIRVHIVGKAFEEKENEKEFWYGTSFCREKIPDDVIERWSNPGLCDELKLPAKNEFIPTCFDIKYNESIKVEKFPVIIEDTPLMRVWFKQDDEFLLPKLNSTFYFISPLSALDPINCNLTYMYTQLFKDSMNEYAYNAGLAGLSWELIPNKYGITLSIGGYHDKHRILLTKIMDKMINFTFDKKRFDILKEHYIRSLKNFETEQPYQHAVYYLAVLLADQVWTKEELLEATTYLTVERLEEFVPQLLSKLHIECLVHGNITEAEALETVKLVESELTGDSQNDKKSRIMVPLLPQQLLLRREISLENGANFLYKIENKLHKSSCTEVYYQSGLQSTESNMHLELLAQIMSEPCFNILRTKEQLGYIVYSGIRKSNGAQGLRIIVQSDRHPSYVEHRIETFIESMLDRLVNMSDEEFNRHKTSLATRRLEKPKMMSILSGMFWSEIISRQYNFDRDNIEVAYLMTINKNQIIQFFKELIYQKSPMRRKLTIHVVSTAEGGAGLSDSMANEIEESVESNIANGAKLITDIIEFKSSQSLFPLLKPFNNIPRKDQQSKL